MNPNTPVFTHEEYNAIFAETVQKITQLGKLKGSEYAGDVDRLANFRRNAENLNLNMEQVWAVYAAKHWDAVMQYVQDTATGKNRERMESIDGRLDDLIVYCILAKCMVSERDRPLRISAPNIDYARRGDDISSAGGTRVGGNGAGGGSYGASITALEKSWPYPPNAPSGLHDNPRK